MRIHLVGNVLVVLLLIGYSRSEGSLKGTKHTDSVQLEKARKSVVDNTHVPSQDSNVKDLENLFLSKSLNLNAKATPADSDSNPIYLLKCEYEVDCFCYKGDYLISGGAKCRVFDPLQVYVALTRQYERWYPASSSGPVEFIWDGENSTTTEQDAMNALSGLKRRLHLEASILNQRPYRKRPTGSPPSPTPKRAGNSWLAAYTNWAAGAPTPTPCSPGESSASRWRPEDFRGTQYGWFASCESPLEAWNAIVRAYRPAPSGSPGSSSSQAPTTADIALFVKNFLSRSIDPEAPQLQIIQCTGEGGGQSLRQYEAWSDSHSLDQSDDGDWLPVSSSEDRRWGPQGQQWPADDSRSSDSW